MELLDAASSDDVRRRVIWSIPTVLAVLGTTRPDKTPHMMNISWVMPVSSEPTRVMLSIESTSVTCANLRQHPHATLTLIDEAQRAIGRAFVKPDLRVDAEARTINDHAYELAANATPWLLGALGVLSGPVTEVLDLGGHVVFLLEVREVAARPEVLLGPASAHEVTALSIHQTRMNYGG